MFHVEHPVVFDNTCRRNGLLLNPGQIEQLVLYVNILLEWNSRVNLVSRKDEENIWESHILHSVSRLFGREFPDELVVLDIGTGGGLPGIPLAIAKPGWSVTLLDSIGKKTVALTDIVQRMGMERVNVVNGRAEDREIVGKRKGRYDLVVARGVAPLTDLAKWARPYLRPSSPHARTNSPEAFPLPSLVAYKGGDLAGELQDLRVKVPATRQAVTDLVFHGSIEAEIEGKKIVVIQFT
jgi:16S rRNA (guanine527-N7)-methyltransferase